MSWPTIWIVVAILAIVVLLSSCAEGVAIGTTAVNYKREVNDLRARATMAALCDLSVGSSYRVLTPQARELQKLQCDPSAAYDALQAAKEPRRAATAVPTLPRSGGNSMQAYEPPARRVAPEIGRLPARVEPTSEPGLFNGPPTNPVTLPDRMK
jgi:hypothetical protein